MPMGTIESELIALKQNGLYRSLSMDEGLDFCSNDYLGLARNATIRDQLIKFLQHHEQIGSTGSRLVSGESEHAHELEHFLAETFSAPAALLFGSGYLANLGVMGAFASPNTTFFSDELNHASLIDGIRLTKNAVEIFRHNDVDHLESLLKKNKSARQVIVTESVFSMDGDTPDLQAIVELSQKHSAFLVVDEAHATGVCGPRGLGLFAGIDWNPDCTVLVHTCGKALGAYGAFVTTGSDLREFLINRARSFIFSTALPPLSLQHIRLSVRYLVEHPELVERLKTNVAELKDQLVANNILFNGSHIAYVLQPGADRAVQAAKILKVQGLTVKAIRPPTVRTGSERLRITVKAFHQKKDFQQLASALNHLP